MDKNSYNILIILHNIRSVHNVGSIFRTADAAGVSKVFLTGVTPGPIDRFGRERKDFAKVSLGAENSLSWEHKKDILVLIDTLRRDGYQIISVEQSPESSDYRKQKIKPLAVFIYGNEVSGLEKSVIEKSDCVVEIPMEGKKESLNVSVSVGISLFRLLENII